MNISFGKNIIKFNYWNTQAEVMNFLYENYDNRILLGEESIYEGDEFYSIEIFDYRKNMVLGIGVISNGFGLHPLVLLKTDNPNEIFIGFSSEVISIDVAKKSINFRINLQCLFHNFIFLEQYGITVIFHEIGVVTINKEGKEIWRKDTDLIQSYEINDKYLFLKFSNSENQEEVSYIRTYGGINLLTGEVD